METVFKFGLARRRSDGKDGRLNRMSDKVSDKVSDNKRTNYKTRQRSELLAYLKAMTGCHVTANDLCSHFTEMGSPVGMTTIYRQLDKMVDEGIVSKYTIDASSPACFEYIDPMIHNSRNTCFHCKCDRCGKLIHLHCHDLEMIQEHLLKEHGFRMNPYRTVFYGLCEECGKETAE